MNFCMSRSKNHSMFLLTPFRSSGAWGDIPARQHTQTLQS